MTCGLSAKIERTGLCGTFRPFDGADIGKSISGNLFMTKHQPVVQEEDDEEMLLECCPDCGFDDCPVAMWEIERIRRLRAYNDGNNEPKIDPLDIMVIAGLPRHELDR